MPNCSVLWCQSRSDVHNNTTQDITTFHRFPKVPSIKSIWIKATGRSPKWIPTPYSTICSGHFEPASFEKSKNGLRTYILKCAVPTLNLPFHVDINKTEPLLPIKCVDLPQSEESSPNTSPEQIDCIVSLHIKKEIDDHNLNPDEKDINDKAPVLHDRSIDISHPEESLLNKTISERIDGEASVDAKNENNTNLDDINAISADTPKEQMMKNQIQCLKFKEILYKKKIKRLQYLNRTKAKKITDLENIMSFLSNQTFATDEDNIILKNIKLAASEIAKRKLTQSKTVVKDPLI